MADADCEADPLAAELAAECGEAANTLAASGECGPFTGTGEKQTDGEELLPEVCDPFGSVRNRLPSPPDQARCAGELSSGGESEALLQRSLLGESALRELERGSG